MEDQREAIAHELDHRIKNVLSVVGAIVSLTAKSASSVEEFRDSLQQRLRGLAATQGFLGRNKGQELKLSSLLHAELAHFKDTHDSNIRISGADVPLSASAVQPLALAFHELATNSAKYGALGAPQGSVAITTNLMNDGAKRLVAIEWCESGGPPARPSDKQGFGTLLIEQMIKRVFQGEVTLDFRPGGMVCQMMLPTNKLDGSTP